MKRYELAYDLSWVVLAFLICAKALSLSVWGPDGPGSGLVPFATGLIIGVCGLLLFLSEWLKGSRKKGAAESFWEHPEAWKRILGLLAGFFAMAFLMPLLGFLLSSILVMFFLIQVVERQKVIKVILIALISCIPIYLFFNLIFEIRLPKGILSF
jgi:putative tricarboxylic transport membrane protein